MNERSIRFALTESPLGLLLVAVTRRGACSVRIGASRGGLEAGLRGEFPSPTLVRDDGGLVAWTDALIGLAQGRGADPALPLDLAAGGFRGRVWDALRAIPRGRTRGYGELACRVGTPRAARAVGQACATNPVALLVPCHRVVPADGGLGGYRWGAWRKRALLCAEGAEPGEPRDGCRAPAAAR